MPLLNPRGRHYTHPFSLVFTQDWTAILITPHALIKLREMRPQPHIELAKQTKAPLRSNRFWVEGNGTSERREGVLEPAGWAGVGGACPFPSWVDYYLAS